MESRKNDLAWNKFNITNSLLLWEENGWFKSAEDWIHSALRRKSIKVLGQIQQFHIRPWSTVMRATTEDGLFFFKASAAYFGHEAALSNFLGNFRHELFPDIFAFDSEKNWLLMRDSGIPLRQYIQNENSIERWMQVIPAYVDLQKSLISHKTTLLEFNVPDRRLSQLPGMLIKLLGDKTKLLIDQAEGLTGKEYEILKSSVPTFEQMCDQLSSFGIPESLHHDDFHDGNIFVGDNRYVFTDWGESAVAHPFFSLVVMLRSIGNTLSVKSNAIELQVLRDHYLSFWTDYAQIDVLRQAAKLAECIGYINRALTWHMVISELPDKLISEYSDAVPAYLKEFLACITDKNSN